jgi:hypothetical protein
MSASLRDLNRRVDALPTHDIDAAALIRQGEARLRRRRLTAVLGSAVAVVVVIAVALVLGTWLNGPVKRSDGPVDRPTSSPEAPLPRPVRKIVYSDDVAFAGPPSGSVIGTLQVGNRGVEIDQTVGVRNWGGISVTDAGAVYAQTDHSLWFTDGGPPQQIAEQACANPSGDQEDLATGNAGPLIAWFDCAPGSREDLVVSDTNLGREVARHTVPSCGAAWAPDGGQLRGCRPDGLIGDHVYFTHFNQAGRLIDHQFRLDLTSDKVIPAGPAMYAEDLRTHPRALVIGDSWRAGTLMAAHSALDGVDFRVVGSRLVPTAYVSASDETVPTRAFNAATGHPVQFRLPKGYPPDPVPGFDTLADPDALTGNDDFETVQWVDDDTVALMGGLLDDIITCHLSDGSCQIAVKQPPDNAKLRMMPGGILPG